MHAMVAILIGGVGLLGAAPDAKKTSTAEAANGAATYESLATAIIAIRATEDSLVAHILSDYLHAADDEFAAALADEKGRVAHLEAAASQVTNIASEGDKRVQSVRQRLAKAGHTHHTDADTKDDYMFVNSKEKKELLALAKKIAQLGAKATPAQIASSQKELSDAFGKCMKPE